jgi:hypothetical protein
MCHRWRRCCGCTTQQHHKTSTKSTLRTCRYSRIHLYLSSSEGMKPLKHEQKKLPFVFTQVPLEQFPLSISHSFMSIQDMNPLLVGKLSRPWICLFRCFSSERRGKQDKHARKGKRRKKKSKSLILLTSHSTLLYLGV